ncbi:MAG: membrane protein insertase YidC [candidate division Zixibacteria bacterium]|nr:membrane protein insertase YidC [candidate division Zixibacteria bacterium]
MDKKTLPLVIILVIIIIFYGQILQFFGLAPEQSKQPTPEQPATAIDTSQNADVIWPDSQKVPVTKSLTSPPKATELSGEMLADSAVHDTVVVRTNNCEFTLSSFGGGPVSIKLPEYTYRDGRIIEMLPMAERATPDMVFAGGTFSVSDFSYQCNLAPGKYDSRQQITEVMYTYTSPEGGQIVKTYYFYPDEYHYDLTFEINGREHFGFERKYNLVWNSPLGVTEPRPETDYEAMEAVAMMSGSREKLDDFDDGQLNQSLTGYTSWAGVRAKYFASMLIPLNREAEGVFARGEKRKVATPDGHVEQKKIIVGLDMPFANVSSFSDSITVFVGPLDYTLLSRYNVDLEDMLDIGTTPVVGWIIKPFAIGIIWLLPRLYNVIPNYGLVIILFAMMVKIITLPLSMKSFKSMQAMRELQPKIDELKKKHKKNPQAMNAEVMKMYKKHGVNPISGCLPMLPQMPLFFALFSVFRSTILLRDAPFVWFITDLSQGATSPTDPYIVLVVIMVVAQFLSQKLTMPSTQQNKALGYLMPLFFGFIFYKFSAGLVLYWICFSVFSLLDYFLFKRKKNKHVQTA